MTSEELYGLLDFIGNLDTVEILSETEFPEDHGIYIVAKLTTDEGDVFTLPFVHYDGEDWIFMPRDWDSELSFDPESAEDIDWIVNDTKTEGIVLNGLPRLPMWFDNPRNIAKTLRRSLGKALKDTREKNGISIRGLAEKTGVNKSQICRIEAGRLNAGIDTINALALALGMELTLVSNQDSKDAKRYEVYYNDKDNMSKVVGGEFGSLEDAIAAADSYTQGHEPCTGDPYTDLSPSFFMSVYDTAIDPEEDDNFGIVYKTDWFWGEI